LAINERLKLLKGQGSDDCESGFEALGQIGMGMLTDLYKSVSSSFFVL
jgi:hypothetical protein